MKSKITLKQQYWLDHILAAKKSELSFADYAKQHQLNIKALYNWRKLLQKKGLLGTAEHKESAFLKVSSLPTNALSNRTSITVTLPNGVRIDIPSIISDLPQLIQTLVKL